MSSDSASSEVTYTSISSHGDPLAWACWTSSDSRSRLTEPAPTSPDYVPALRIQIRHPRSALLRYNVPGPESSKTIHADGGNDDDDDSSDDDEEEKELLRRNEAGSGGRRRIWLGPDLWHERLSDLSHRCHHLWSTPLLSKCLYAPTPPLPPPSPLSPWSSPLPQIPSPPLPPPPSSLHLPPPIPTSNTVTYINHYPKTTTTPASLFIPPPVDRREEKPNPPPPEAELPPRKRLCLTALHRGMRIPYVREAKEVLLGLEITWVRPREAAEEIAPVTLEGVNTRDRQTQIFQSVETLIDDRQYYYETARLLDQEALSLPEALHTLWDLVRLSIMSFMDTGPTLGCRITARSEQFRLRVRARADVFLSSRALVVVPRTICHQEILYTARVSAAAVAAAPMTVAAVEQLIEARVSAALANLETLRNSTNGHGDRSHI
ncbi:hypothetical protein Tco_0285845 [Tanacetum coccineum]